MFVTPGNFWNDRTSRECPESPGTPLDKLERLNSKFGLHLPRRSVSPVGDTFTFTPCASVIGQRATGAAGGGLRMRTHGLARGKCTFSTLSNCTSRPVTDPRSPFLAGATSVVMRVTIDGKSTRRDVVRTRDITLIPRDERKLRTPSAPILTASQL